MAGALLVILIMSVVLMSIFGQTDPATGKMRSAGGFVPGLLGCLFVGSAVFVYVITRPEDDFAPCTSGWQRLRAVMPDVTEDEDDEETKPKDYGFGPVANVGRV